MIKCKERGLIFLFFNEKFLQKKLKLLVVTCHFLGNNSDMILTADVNFIWVTLVKVWMRPSNSKKNND